MTLGADPLREEHEQLRRDALIARRNAQRKDGKLSAAFHAACIPAAESSNSAPS